MARPTYSELLRHPKWQMKRLEILKRDKATCQLCDDQETELHIHHKEYLPGMKPWEYNNSVLITYCKHCHRIVEWYKTNRTGDTILRIDKRVRAEGEWFYVLIYGISTEIASDKNYFASILSYNPSTDDISYNISVSQEALESMTKCMKSVIKKHNSTRISNLAQSVISDPNFEPTF